MQKLQDIQRAMELLSTCQGPAKNIDEATKHKYQFWDTQPVPKLSESYVTSARVWLQHCKTWQTRNSLYLILILKQCCIQQKNQLMVYSENATSASQMKAQAQDV